MFQPGMKHFLIDLYEVYSDGAPRVGNSPVTGGFGFENKKNAYKSSSELLGSNA